MLIDSNGFPGEGGTFSVGYLRYPQGAGGHRILAGCATTPCLSNDFDYILPRDRTFTPIRRAALTELAKPDPIRHLIDMNEQPGASEEEGSADDGPDVRRYAERAARRGRRHYRHESGSRFRFCFAGVETVIGQRRRRHAA